MGFVLLAGGSPFCVIPNHDTAVSSAPLKSGDKHHNTSNRIKYEKGAVDECPRKREEVTNQSKIVGLVCVSKEVNSVL